MLLVYRQAQSRCGGCAIATEIRALLEERGGIVVRHLYLSDEQQLALAKSLETVRLRNVEKDGQVRAKTDNGIFRATFDRAHNPTYVQYLIGTFGWHVDGTWEQTPPLASILTRRVLVPRTSSTMFSLAQRAN
jgi:alpha-ketoglutarate-dependent taurine dioxygenase